MPIFFEFMNKDSGQLDWVDVHHIYRVFACLEPDHLGCALVWLDQVDLDGKPVVLLADMDAVEFMNQLNRTIYNASNESNPTRRNHGKQH